MKPLKAIAALLLLGATFASGYVLHATRSQNAPTHTSTQRRILYYVDPMHPAYKSDKPGIAPDCGMELEPVYADEPTATVGTGAQKILYYRDPQQPSYTADKPGLNPETGNTLEPVYEPATDARPPAGTIKISPERQQLIGVKFATVQTGGASRTIRAVGKVAADETRVGHVHTRTDGWIDKVFVDFTGDLVKSGQPMFTVYSPELLASQQELLLAARARDLMRDNPLASAAEHSDTLFAAARRRLELWDLSEDQIDQVLHTGQPIRCITVRAPMSGFVTARNAFPNQKVTPDSDLYTITDLSHVWIVADVYESDITSIKVGDSASIAFANAAAPPLKARVTYIQPQVDPTTRTVQVRLDAHNATMRLKPEMFVNVEFGVSMTPQLTVPIDAVLDSGNRQTVFVDRGNGYLEPRQVVAGERFNDRVVITSGVSAGERVVASGTFLVDSESQLKAAVSGMGAPHDPERTSSGPQGGPETTRPTDDTGAALHKGHGRD